MHGQELAAALVVVVREHRSADAGQRGVAPEEVSGETVDEIQQMTEGVAVHMHRRVLGVHADAVLVEIAVRGELPEPVLSAERDRHRAQRALVAPGESLVLVANRAGRVASGHRVAGRRLLHVLELGLGQVDRDGQPVRVEARVTVEHGLLHVVVGHAVVVEPAHGPHAALGPLDAGEAVLQRGGACGEQPHHHIRVDRAFIGIEQPGRHAGRAEVGQQLVDGPAAGRRASRMV